MAEVLKTNNMARTKGSGFKMKGSPMQRNFGVGSPTKLMGLLKRKVNKELESPAGQLAAKALMGGM
jgi:hypothetical protein